MAMANTPNPVKILDVCLVNPSPKSTAQSSLPLTYFDIAWLKFHPVERIFFYQLNDLTRSFFDSILLPTLKSSLSLALLHFHPVAGKIRWPSHASKPSIIYFPTDGISLTVAESNSDFARLSANQKVEALESHFFVPELHVSDSEAATMAIQITLFPNQGFSIGITSHHAVFDGKSIVMFIKAWAYLCKQSKIEKNPTLPPELTPLLDRQVIEDPEGLDMIFLKELFETKIPGLKDEPRSLKLIPFNRDLSNLVRATFELSPEDIKKLRQKVIAQVEDDDKIKSMHLSKFVLSYAYTAVCMVKAKRLEPNKKIVCGFVGDCRARLEPAVPENYMGNCCKTSFIISAVEALVEDKGVAFVAEKLSEMIKEFERRIRSGEGKRESIARVFKTIMESGVVATIGVAGSPRFEVYGTDFGWGKPKKVDITSVDKGESISMAESGSGSGGIEIGLVLNVDEMQTFDSLFVSCLKDI